MKLPLSPELLSDIRALDERGLFARLPSPGNGVQTPGMLIISGTGAGDFLQGQLTSDIDSLAVGAGQPSARVTRKGMLTHLITAHRLEGAEERFVLLTDGNAAAALADDLEQFLFSDDITIRDLTSDREWLLLEGPLAAEIAGAAWGPIAGSDWHELSAHEIRRFERAGLPSGCLVARQTLSDAAGFLVAAPSADGAAAILTERMTGFADEAGLARPGGDSLVKILDIRRIEAGVPRVGVDMVSGKQLLPETGLETKIADYDKGCYLGQEVIARIRTYGSTARALRALILRSADDSALLNLPDPGSKIITTEGKTIGHFGSACWSPVHAAPLALAFLTRKWRTPGERLTLQGKRFDFTADVALAEPAPVLDDGEALYERAIDHFAERRDAEAIADLEDALRINPSFTDAYEALGVILGRSERFDEAIRLFRTLEEIAPDEPMVNTNLSLYYMKLGDKEAAEIEMAKGTTKRFKLLADEDSEQKRQQEQREDAERKLAMFAEVLEIDSEDPLALGGMGSALYALDRFAEAEPYLSRACKKQPDNASLFLARGKALEKLGEPDHARAVYSVGIAAASRKGSLMPLGEMEKRVRLLDAATRAS